jgi:hypothetical protein
MTKNLRSGACTHQVLVGPAENEAATSAVAVRDALEERVGPVESGVLGDP